MITTGAGACSGLPLDNLDLELRPDVLYVLYFRASLKYCYQHFS